MWCISYGRWCSYHAASKFTFRVYIYIKGLDLLFSGPKFNYNSTVRTKLRDSIKGLVVLRSILNEDVREYFKACCDAFQTKFSRCEKCGWAKAVTESNASYKREMLIEQPGLSSPYSPSPTPEEETSDAELAEVAKFQLAYQRKKLRLSLDSVVPLQDLKVEIQKLPKKSTQWMLNYREHVTQGVCV